jgi:hypothetical protein
MSDIFNGLSERYTLDAARGKASQYWGVFSEFCSPLQISIVIVVVHLLFTVRAWWNDSRKKGSINLASHLRPILMMSALIAVTYYFCREGQHTFAWIALLVYTFSVWSTMTFTDGISQVDDRVISLFQVKEDAVPTPPSAPAQSCSAPPMDLMQNFGGDQPYDPAFSPYSLL